MRKLRMKYSEMMKTDMQQSAEDMSCDKEDFMKDRNVVVPIGLGNGARKYLIEPITCNLISYGNNIVAVTCDETTDLVGEYLNRYGNYHCFETPNMHWLNERLVERGHKICFMAEYFLPERIPDLSCPYTLRILKKDELLLLDFDHWENAISKERIHLQKLGVGAYDGNKLIGVAACTADCDVMWQIGVDVLPEYRKQGVASALTSRLAGEIVKQGKVPFYCCAWSNIGSLRNALKSGFVPSWVEMTAKLLEIVDEMNR